MQTSQKFKVMSMGTMLFFYLNLSKTKIIFFSCLHFWGKKGKGKKVLSKKNIFHPFVHPFAHPFVYPFTHLYMNPPLPENLKVSHQACGLAKQNLWPANQD